MRSRLGLKLRAIEQLCAKRGFGAVGGVFCIVALSVSMGIPGRMIAAQEANASSLRDLRAREAEEKKLEDEIAFTSRICEVAITASIDWAKSGNWPPAQSLAEACDAALGAVEAACRGEQKAHIQKSVSAFTCSADKTGARLDSGILFFGADTEKDGFLITKAVLDDIL